jgi:hypothetical protein
MNEIVEEKKKKEGREMSERNKKIKKSGGAVHSSIHTSR